MQDTGKPGSTRHVHVPKCKATKCQSPSCRPSVTRSSVTGGHLHLMQLGGEQERAQELGGLLVVKNLHCIKTSC